MKVRTDFNHWVPKDIRDNIKWRAKVHNRVLNDPSYAAVIREACSKDPLFFINGFGWAYDPRREPFPKIPFILYPFQEEALLEIFNAINNYDLMIEKSRDMGGSCVCILATGWCWAFKAMQSFLYVSRVEDYVDKPGNPKSMFWKFDYLIDNLPEWLKPRGYNKDEHRTSMHAKNPESGSVIDGESTNRDVARGDRRTAIILDEFAAVRDGERVLSATRDATKSRLFNSTPDPETGTNNAFYRHRQTNIKKVRLHWTAHPMKATGLYTRENNKFTAIDTEYWKKFEDFESEMKRLDAMIASKEIPLPDGKLRSPFYADQCDRAHSAREIATELDIDYIGSAGVYFSPDKIQEAIIKCSRPPQLTGELEYDFETSEPTKFISLGSGKLQLWCLLDGKNKPPQDHKTVVGCDVSAGTGASNSCAVFWDLVTHEKVAQYVNPFIRAEEFAKQVVALAKWFGGSRIIWESGGPGRAFGSVVEELRYTNFYLRKDDESIKGKVSNIPGVAQNSKTKTSLMSSYRDAIYCGKCVNKSKIALEDTLEYVYGVDGCPTHSKSNNKEDPSGARENHGDRAMADALAWKLLKENVFSSKTEKAEIPVGCLAWRIEQRKKLKEKQSNDGW